MDQRKLYIRSIGSGSGKTTALLDIALANAARGEQVVYWCRTSEQAGAAYRAALDLLRLSESWGGISNIERFIHSFEKLTIEFPCGSVRFGCDAMRPQIRGYRASVVVNDDAVMPAPEPMHAHTVIS